MLYNKKIMKGLESRDPRLGTRESLSKQYQPEVRVYRTAAEAYQYAASRVVSQVQQKPESNITGLTGNTGIGFWAAVRETGVDLSQASIIMLDEYYPIDPANKNSYRAFMQRNLLDHVEVGEFHIPDGGAPNAEVEAARYQAILDQHPIDLAVIGIGSGLTGHIGFNERGSTRDSRTRYAKMAEKTREVNSALFDRPEEFPEGTITQGVADITGAKEVVLVATGPEKAEGILHALTDPISPEFPASFLRLHPRVTIVLDEAAASKWQDDQKSSTPV